MQKVLTKADAVKRSEHEISIPLFNLGAGNIPKEFIFKNVDADLTSEAGLQIKTNSAKHFATSVTLKSKEGWNWSELPNFCFAFDAVNLNERSTQVFINILISNNFICNQFYSRRNLFMVTMKSNNRFS